MPPAPKCSDTPGPTDHFLWILQIATISPGTRESYIDFRGLVLPETQRYLLLSPRTQQPHSSVYCVPGPTCSMARCPRVDIYHTSLPRQTKTLATVLGCVIISMAVETWLVACVGPAQAGFRHLYHFVTVVVLCIMWSLV